MARDAWMKMNAVQSLVFAPMDAVSITLEVTDVIAMMVSRSAPLGQNVLIPVKDLVSLKSYRRCASFHLLIETWLPNLNAAVMEVGVGATNVNCVPFLELQLTRRCVHMVLASPQMEEIWTNVPNLPNPATLYVRIQRAATSAHVLEDTFYKKMARHVKTWMNVQLNSTTASSYALILLEASIASVLLDLPSTSLHVLITMSAMLNQPYAELVVYAKTTLEVSPVNVRKASPWTTVEATVKLVYFVAGSSGTQTVYLRAVSSGFPVFRF
ncbi:unnamed protein product [Ranitomeya imitator]|uniref:Uncharacterized protein n=1 Tax=Ranitomeya imitator TaxID=111125 RepID=A0ABN9L7S3_9NEOB|nr:unnamed protein product [Ranitomeya imitator]